MSLFYASLHNIDSDLALADQLLLLEKTKDFETMPNISFYIFIKFYSVDRAYRIFF